MGTHDRPAGIPTRADIVEGSYTGTTDDRAGRWYVTDAEAGIIDKRGPGFATRGEAWTHLLGPHRPCSHDVSGSPSAPPIPTTLEKTQP